MQLYAERTSASAVERPRRWLIGFATARLLPGEQRVVSIPVPWRRLAHWDDGWNLERGEFRLIAALASDQPGVGTSIRVA